MKRYRKKRFARRLDQARSYRPDHGDQIKAVVITLDEFEALRLCDYEALSQIDAARDMNVSRATIQRLLESGRKKMIQAVLMHQGFKIENTIEHIKLKGENRMSMDTKTAKKIAFPTSDKKHVDQHFGHTEAFCLYTVEDNQVKDVSYVTPPPHKPGALPLFLRDHGVDVIITGGMGNRAVELFKHNKIDVILGAEGSIEKNLNDFFDGDLVSTVSPCEHDHGDHGHEKRPNQGMRSNNRHCHNQEG
ncbi:MAG: NifB/NifX family molybdenum-iron cluster-binding protein [Candidatus Izemoplasmataceae bacterium]